MVHLCKIKVTLRSLTLRIVSLEGRPRPEVADTRSGRMDKVVTIAATWLVHRAAVASWRNDRWSLDVYLVLLSQRFRRCSGAQHVRDHS